MKLKILLLSSIFTIGTSFFLPFFDIKVKKYTIADFYNFDISYVPEVDIIFAKYNKKKCAKNTLLFISGLEFSSISLAPFIKELDNDFNLVFLCSKNNKIVPSIDSISNTIEIYINKNSLKNVTLIGESSGSIIALHAGYSETLKNEINGVILLNSATAYFNSPMNYYINKLNNIDYFIAILFYITLQDFDISMLNTETVYMMSLMLINLFYFPKELLLERIDKWIINHTLEDKLPNYPHNVVLVASTKDELFDSVEEANRLNKILPKSKIVHVHNCKHLITPNRFSLSKVIKYLL